MYCEGLPLEIPFWPLSGEHEPVKEPNKTSKIRNFHWNPGRRQLAPAKYIGYPRFPPIYFLRVDNWEVYMVGNALKPLPNDSPDSGVEL